MFMLFVDKSRPSREWRDANGHLPERANDCLYRACRQSGTGLRLTSSTCGDLEWSRGLPHSGLPAVQAQSLVAVFGIAGNPIPPSIAAIRIAGNPSPPSDGVFDALESLQATTGGFVSIAGNAELAKGAASWIAGKCAIGKGRHILDCRQYPIGQGRRLRDCRQSLAEQLGDATRHFA